MNRMLVATGFFVSVVLLLNGCCCPTHMYTPSCGAGCGLGCGSGGCGEVYWGEWMSDPPAPCDPCDNCGNWTGGCSSCSSCGSCGGPCGSWLCNLFSPCPLLWGNRCADAGPMGMTMAYDGGYEMYEDGAMIVPEGEEIMAPQESTPVPAKQPTPAKRSEARQYVPRSTTAGTSSPHYRTAGRTVVDPTHTMSSRSYTTTGQTHRMQGQPYRMQGQTYVTQDQADTMQEETYTMQGQPYTMPGQTYVTQGQTRATATQAQRPRRQVSSGAIR